MWKAPAAAVWALELAAPHDGLAAHYPHRLAHHPALRRRPPAAAGLSIPRAHPSARRIRGRFQFGSRGDAALGDARAGQCGRAGSRAAWAAEGLLSRLTQAPVPTMPHTVARTSTALCTPHTHCHSPRLPPLMHRAYCRSARCSSRVLSSSTPRLTAAPSLAQPPPSCASACMQRCACCTAAARRGRRDATMHASRGCARAAATGIWRPPSTRASLRARAACRRATDARVMARHACRPAGRGAPPGSLLENPAPAR